VSYIYVCYIVVNSFEKMLVVSNIYVCYIVVNSFEKMLVVSIFVAVGNF